MLGEGLHCEEFAVGQAFDLVDSCEATFAQFSEGLEEIVEADLVHHPTEVFEPDREQVPRNYLEFDGHGILLHESEPYRRGKDGILLASGVILRQVDHLELEIEVDLGAVEVGVVKGVLLADGEVVSA